MDTRTRDWAGLLLFALVATWAVAGFASADDDSARLHFQAGAKDFSAGRFESALHSFTAAYELSARPQLLYNIALCEEELRRFGDAALHLRRFLEEVDDVPHRAALERRIELLETAAAKQAEEEADAPELVDEEALREPPPEDRRAAVPPAAWASFGVGGAALVTGIALGTTGLTKKNGLESGCGATSSCDRDEVERMERLGIVADVSFALAIAAAATGTALIFVLREREDDPAVAVSPWVTTGSAGVSIRGRF
jgi:tetratricopeptide (TPR) repeat protein